MKKRIVSKIMLMALTASLAGLFGCDEKKSDKNGLMLPLLAAGSGSPTWTVITPADGAINVSTEPAEIVIQCSVELDATFDDEEVNLIKGGLFTIRLNKASGDDFVITGNTVTIDTLLDTSKTYSSITITGFRDAHGNTIPDYNIPDYDFTTEGK